MDWVADDHAVIVEMNRLMKKTVEFNQQFLAKHFHRFRPWWANHSGH